MEGGGGGGGGGGRRGRRREEEEADKEKIKTDSRAPLPAPPRLPVKEGLVGIHVHDHSCGQVEFYRRRACEPVPPHQYSTSVPPLLFMGLTRTATFTLDDMAASRLLHSGYRHHTSVTQGSQGEDSSSPSRVTETRSSDTGDGVPCLLQLDVYSCVSGH